MKSEINIDQKKIIEGGLNVDLIDVILIGVLIDFSNESEAVKIVSGKNEFIWFSYKRINQEIPLLRLKEDTIYRRLKRLCSIGLLIHFEGSKTLGKAFFSITAKGCGLKSDVPEIKEVSEEIPKVEEKPIEKPKPVRKKATKKDLPKVEEVLMMKSEPPKQSKDPKPVDKLYSEMVKIYFEWFEKLSGVKPKFGAIEGVAMKQIINYFKTIHADAKDGTDEFEEVTKMFRYIFNKWKSIEPFYQDQTKVTQINSNLQNIIIQIKNGSARKSGSKDKSNDARSERLQNSFSRIDEMLSSKKQN